MKKMIGLMLLISMTSQVQARLAGTSTLTVQEKLNNGINIKLLSKKGLNKSGRVIELKYLYGADSGAFKLVLNAKVLLPKIDQYSPLKTQVKIGTTELLLPMQTSAQVYSELAIDYTAKKIAEGVVTGDSVIKCTDSQKCSLVDTRGDFWLFQGSRHSLKHTPGEFFASMQHGRNKYKNLNNEVAIFNSNNEISEELIKEVTDKVFELAPTLFAFEHTASSVPSHDEAKTIKLHQKEAYARLMDSFGETSLEKMIVESMLVKTNVTYKELFRRPSSGACTYSCGRSGRFVSARVTSDVSFY